MKVVLCRGSMKTGNQREAPQRGVKRDAFEVREKEAKLSTRGIDQLHEAIFRSDGDLVGEKVGRRDVDYMLPKGRK